MGNIQQQWKNRKLKPSIANKRKVLVFVLGGPCSGKTTQCNYLSENFHLAHICPEAIIRDCLDEINMQLPSIRLERLHQRRLRIYNAIKVHERMSKEEREFLGTSVDHKESQEQLFTLRRQSDSEDEDDNYPKLLRDLQMSIREGKPIDPSIITVLVKEVMDYTMPYCNGFVVDGYPRNLTQASMFFAEIGEPHLIFHLECPEEVLYERILQRAKSQQRSDDNYFTIPFKFQNFQKHTVPLMDQQRERLGDGNAFLTIFADRQIDTIARHLELDMERIFSDFKFKRFKDHSKIRNKRRSRLTSSPSVP